MARVLRVGLFRREIRESVSPTALEVLLAGANRISEGQVSNDGRYYGSTMLTIDLADLEPRVRDRCDVATAAKLAPCLEQDPSLQRSVARLALDEAQRIVGRKLRQAEIDIRVRTEGCRIFVDADVEGIALPRPLARTSDR